MLFLCSPPALVSQVRVAPLQPLPFSALPDLQSFVHLILTPCIGLLVSTERPYFHGSGGTRLPTRHIVNLRPPPSSPGCHLLFGPLSTWRWTSQPGSSQTLPGLHCGSHAAISSIRACLPVEDEDHTGSLLYVLVWLFADCDLQMGTSMELYIEKWECAYSACAHNPSRIQRQVTTSTFSTSCLSSTKALRTRQPHSQQLLSVLGTRKAREANFRWIKCDIQKIPNGKRIL